MLKIDILEEIEFQDKIKGNYESERWGREKDKITNREAKESWGQRTGEIIQVYI